MSHHSQALHFWTDLKERSDVGGFGCVIVQFLEVRVLNKSETKTEDKEWEGEE